MDKRAIGVFDSGLGGLTCVRELRRLAPGEDLVYFGDTGRVPYGTRSRETIQRYARQDVRFLRSFDLKAIIVACNTVSANALAELRAENDVPVYGTIAPAARVAAASTQNRRVGLIGTAASVRSGAYERAISALDPTLRVYAKACPLFVPLVENGRYRLGDQVVELVAQDYLTEVKAKEVDTLIMGCTHYPLLSAVIAKTMGPGVKLVDSGAECAAAALRDLEVKGLLSGKAAGESRFYVSDSTEDFARLASTFLGESVTGQVERVVIQEY